jgi:hypothetical protein
MIDPALEPSCRLVSEKYKVRGWIPAATYHKVSRFAPGRGAGCPTIVVLNLVVHDATRHVESKSRSDSIKIVILRRAN